MPSRAMRRNATGPPIMNPYSHGVGFASRVLGTVPLCRFRFLAIGGKGANGGNGAIGDWRLGGLATGALMARPQLDGLGRILRFAQDCSLLEAVGAAWAWYNGPSSRLGLESGQAAE
jgi:hypothetical protein